MINSVIPDFNCLTPFTITNTGVSGYVWSQKTIYRAPEPDHAAHIAKAEAKRKRKAEKLMRQQSRGGDNVG